MVYDLRICRGAWQIHVPEKRSSDVLQVSALLRKSSMLVLNLVTLSLQLVFFFLIGYSHRELPLTLRESASDASETVQT